MLRVGLTGGIASGKSTVSALLAGRGAVVIDYDLLAREVVERGSPALVAIAERFGVGVVADDGTLDRAALGALVFADPDALQALNRITHPAIGALADAREKAADPGAIVVHDNPLLVEMGGADLCDVVIVVDVPEDVQIERLTAIRGLSATDARARLDAQVSRNKRTGAADLLIDNTGSLDELDPIVGSIWATLLVRSAVEERRLQPEC